MSKRWIKSVMRPMVTLALALSVSVDRYNPQSVIINSDEVAYGDISACTVDIHDAEGIDNSVTQFCEIDLRERAATAELTSNLAKTLPTVERSEYKTNVIEEEKRRLDKLVVFSVLCDILLYKMKFDSEDNGSVDRFNTDPETNEPSSGNQDNGFINKWLLLSIVSALAPMHVDNPKVVHGSSKVAEKMDVDVVAVPNVIQGTNQTKPALKRLRTADGVAASRLEYVMTDNLSPTSTRTPSSSPRIDLKISDPESIKVEAAQQNIKQNAHVHVNPLKSANDAVAKWSSNSDRYDKCVGNHTKCIVDGVSYNSVFIRCSGIAREESHRIANVDAKKELIFSEIQSAIQSDMADVAGINVLRDTNNGVGLFVDSDQKLRFIYTFVEIDIDPLAREKILVTYNQLQSGDIKLDADSNLPKEACDQGVKLLKPSHGRYSHNFMNFEANKPKCSECAINLGSIDTAGAATGPCSQCGK